MAKFLRTATINLFVGERNFATKIKKQWNNFHMCFDVKLEKVHNTNLSKKKILIEVLHASSKAFWPIYKVRFPYLIRISFSLKCLKALNYKCLTYLDNYVCFLGIFCKTSENT